MRILGKVFLAILLVLPASSIVAQTCSPTNGIACTPNLDLWVPPVGYQMWQVPVNYNWYLLDTASTYWAKVNHTNTFTAEQNFSGSINLSGANSPLMLNGSAGTTGQCPISQGSSTTPVWGTCGSGGGDAITSPNGTLTVGGTSANTTLDLALGNANTWTGPQTFVSPALGTPASGIITFLSGTCTGCTANSSTNVATTNTTANASYYLTFVAASTTGNQAVDVNASFSVNPSTGVFSAPSYSATGTCPLTGSGAGLGCSIYTQASLPSAGNASTDALVAGTSGFAETIGTGAPVLLLYNGITGAVLNGVTLNSTGSSSLFLNQAGNYTSASGGGDTITSPNSTLTVGGTTSATTLDLVGAAGMIMAGATPALTYTPSLGVDGSNAGTLSLANGSASAHTVFGSAATTTNTILGPATVPTTLHLFYAAVSGTTATLTDTGYAYNAIPPANIIGSTLNYYACFNGSGALTTCALDHNSTTSGVDTFSQPAAAPAFYGTGTTQGIDLLGVGTGAITVPSGITATGYTGFVGPTTAGTSYLVRLPSTWTAGLLYAGSPSTVNGVNQAVGSVVSGTANQVDLSSSAISLDSALIFPGSATMGASNILNASPGIFKSGFTPTTFSQSQFICNTTSTTDGYACTTNVGVTETLIPGVIATFSAGSTANTIDGVHTDFAFTSIFDVPTASGNNTFTLYACASGGSLGSNCTKIWQTATSTPGVGSHITIDLRCTVSTTGVAQQFLSVCANRFFPASLTFNGIVASTPTSSASWFLQWSGTFSAAGPAGNVMAHLRDTDMRFIY